MREVREKKRKGCTGCFFVLIVISVLVLLFGYHIAEEAGVKNYFLKLKYPVRYQEFVEDYAEEFHLDESLVYAVIHTESKFDTYAESKVGAKGLMQLTNETGEDCAKKLGIQNFSAEQLFNPEVNIRLGCYYLKKLIREYDGNTQTAIAAYNGGPGNVDKWLADSNYSNGDGILREIPFRETRNYVDKVTEAYWNYQNIYHLDEGVLEDGKE